VIPVHLYGRTVDMDPLLEVARRARLAVVEDACQAHGARYRGRRVGSLGDCGCFSFYPAKNLGAWGDGGAVVTSDPELARRVRLLRAHGEAPRYHHHVPGFTSRLDAIHAAVLRVKLRRLDDWNAGRRRVAAQLTRALQRALVWTPAPATGGADHVFHQYVVECGDRDGLREHLAARGVGSGIHYPVPIHLSGAYDTLGRRVGSFPAAERLAGRICSLPVFPSMSDEQIGLVAASVEAFTPTAEERRAA
jgi:dTDP-3-amino-3,4,6-trideoxy-alpha-D-glucose transaminase